MFGVSLFSTAERATTWPRFDLYGDRRETAGFACGPAPDFDGEVAGALWSDVDLDKRELTVRHTL